MRYKCKGCGIEFNYMPSDGICPYCGEEVGIIMNYIGFIRSDPEEGDLYLLQCPRCKKVIISNNYKEICFCEGD